MFTATVLRHRTDTVRILSDMLTHERHMSYGHVLHFVVTADEVTVSEAMPFDRPVRSYHEAFQSAGRIQDSDTADALVRDMLAWADASLAS